ncbi:MAG: leucine-rich repeat protein [Clostridiales bacterium]|nr:leucine-rich repeat protein [Clostridiales bacterium]
MKRPKLLYVLLVFVAAFVGALFVACGSSKKTTTKKPTEGPETGVYYYDADDGEYLITLNNVTSVTILIADSAKTGTYTVSGSNLTFKFSDVQYTAVLNDDILTVNMGENNAALRFTKRITYTVTFNVGSGTAIAPVKVINGKTIARPATPENGDMEFIGWYKDQEYTKPFIFESDTVTGNTTLYARWVEPVFGKSEFTVDFDLNYETAPTMESQTTIAGRLYDLAEPTRTGHTFRGWWVMFDGELSYRVTENTVFAESTTVYALWQSNAASTKLAMPIVDVTSAGISWGSNANARTFHVTVTGPNGETVKNEDSGSTTMAIAFDEMDAGAYTISVTAIAASGNEANNSETAIRKYNNKALARVSLFTVVDPSTLIFNAVEGAEKYILSVECGDVNHAHTAFDNGLLTSFNFVNCKMTNEGIKFTVTATAAGKADSVSKTYVYKRSLAAVSGLRYDAAKEELTWNGVANAAGYIVSLSCDNSAHNHNVDINVGNKTAFSLKDYEACSGDITVEVAPYTKGYISPAPAKLTVKKTTLAAPSDIRIVGNTLTWVGDDNASSYSISIGNATYTSSTTSFDLGDADNTTWTQAADYQIKVMSVGSGAVKSSLWSDPVDARYYAMYSALTYNAGVVAWRHVIGVDYYNVKVNNGAAVQVTDGINKASIRLTQNGVNTISVNFVDEEGNASAFATITVVAHAIEFDLRGGEVAQGGSASAQYYAVGDRLYLPGRDDIEKNGYNFAGWYTTPAGPEGLGALYDDEYFMGVGDTVLYAYWTPETYEITFDYNGGVVGGEVGSATYREHYTWPIATPSDASLVFIGWFSDRYGLEIQYTDETGNSLTGWNITRGMTVYAGWASIFAFEKLSNGTYRIAKNTTYFPSHAPANLLIPVTYQAPTDARPINVTEIGSTSFTNSSMLVKVRIPNSIKYIDNNAFNGSNNIEEFEIYEVEGVRAPEYSTHEGVLYKATLNDFGEVRTKELLLYPRAKKGDYAIPTGVTALPLKCLQYAQADRITIPATVVTIERTAFYYSSASEIVFEFAGNVTEESGVQPLVIFEAAISNCTKLKRVVLPARISDFNPAIFNACNVFEEIDIEPASTDYKGVEGFLCDARGETLLYCPTNKVSGELTLPRSINKIGERAFASNTKITSVRFSQTINEIKAYAFNKCTQLASIKFDIALGSLTIGEYAFEGCTKLATLDFTGSKLTTIGGHAFESCTAVEAITLPNTVTEIGQYAFSKCTKIDTINIPSNVTKIDEFAFNGCTKLANVNFAESDGELSLENSAFNGCTVLTEIDIPKHVTNIGEGVFAGCIKLTTINVDKDNEYYETWEGVLFSKGFEEMLFYPLGKTGNFKLPDQVQSLGARLFKSNTTIESITIGINVTSIGDEAFMGCTGLKTVIFEAGSGANLTLGNSVFEGCTGLEEVRMTDRIKVISYRAFYNCNQLKKFTMPNYVTSIGELAFYNNAFASITIPATVDEIGYRAFYLSKLVTVTFENAPTSVDGDEEGSAPNGGVQYANSLVLLESASTHYAETFYSCSALKTVTLPERLTAIASGMFASCSSLMEIEILNTVDTIGAKAFYGCSALQKVTFEDGNLDNILEMIAAVNGGNPSSTTGIFSGCTSLNSINLPARIKYIPAYTFYNCRALTSITIPNSVKNTTSANGSISIYAIEKNAFQSCSSLQKVTFAAGNENPVTIGPSVFSGCSKLTTLELPKGLTHIVTLDDAGNDISDYYDVFGTDALLSCSVFSVITVEAGGKYYSDDGILYYKDAEKGINEAVYCPISRTKAVVIPYDVTSINARAFFKAWNITSFSFQETPEGTAEVALVINNGTSTTGAFHQFIGITAITLPARLTEVGDYAFYNCSMLLTVTIPEDSKLTRIGNYAFSNCTGMREVMIPAATQTIGVGAFAGNVRTAKFEFAEGSQLQSIGSYAFSENVFTEIVIPDSATTLGASLFSGSRVTTVTLPSNLATLDPDIFAGCDTITDIRISGNSKIVIEDSVIYTADKSVLLFYPANKRDVSYTISSGVTEINAGAFEGSKYLQSITIPNTVTKIGEGAFYGSLSLTTVNFEEDNATTKNTSLNVGSSGDAKGVFQNCERLETVNLPLRTVGLGQYAFTNCSSLSHLTINKNAAIQQINANVFTNAGGGTLALPDSVKTIATNAFTGSLFTEVTFGNQLTTIAANAFDGSGITRVVLPSSLTSLGAAAFANCQNLESAEIKLNSTTKLAITTHTTTTPGTYGKYGTFYNCPNLKTASIASNGELPYHMFYLCPNLTTLTITGSGSIKGYLCYQLTGLKKVEIAKTVTSIGTYAFYQCSNLGSHNPETCTDEKCAGASAHGFAFTGSGNSSLTTLGNYAFESTAISSFDIPNTVTSLGTYLFRYDTALTSVTIPTKSFTSISNYSFYGATSLSNVTFDNSGEGDRKLVTISYGTFYGCTSLTSIDLTGFTTLSCSSTTNSVFYNSGLTSVTIPSSLTNLGSYAFYGSALRSVTLPTDGATTTGTYTFTNCKLLDTVTFAGTGTSLATIGNFAFQNCTSLNSIVFPSGLTTIGSNAFANSGLNTVTLSSTISSIDPQAFLGCKIKSFTINGASGAYTLSGDGKALLSRDGKTLIRYVGSDTAYTVPAGITAIGDYAFYQNETLQEITFNDELETVGSYAFSECEALRSVSLNDGFKDLGSYAFYKCTALDDIELNDELESIGTYAFSYCTALGDVKLPDSLTVLSTYAFANSGITGVTFGSGLETISNYAFAYCENLLSVNIPGNITSIGSSATTATNVFINCTGLESVTFNSGLELIGQSAFSGCSKLNGVVFPNTLETIGIAAFMDCIALTSINIPVNIKVIQKAAFAGCSSLGNVTFAESSEVLTIVYGSGSTNTNRGAFGDCTLLSTIDLSKRPLNASTSTTSATYINCLGDYTFYGCTNLVSCKLPDTLLTIRTYAFANCLYLDEAPMSDSLVEICSSAFRDSGVTKVTLPSTLTTIGTYAFMDCKLLERVTIPGSVTVINSAAFAGCLLLESVTFESDNGANAGIGFGAGTGSSSYNPSLSATSRGVFGDCASLKSIDLSTRTSVINSTSYTTSTYLNKLNNYIFADCIALTSVKLPAGTILIGTGSFFNTGLKSFTLGANIESINNAAFAECSDLETVVVEASNKKIGIANGSSATTIGNYGAFFNCTSLKSVDFSTRSAFYNSATSATSGYAYISGYLFYGCSALESVKFPSNITRVNAYAFYGCSSLKSIDLPNGVDNILANAFQGSGLVNIKLPSSLVYIYESAFRDCKDLQSVQFPTSGTLKYVYAYAFMDCVSLQSLYIPAGISVIRNAVFAGCSSLGSIEFEESADPLGFAIGTGTEGEARGVFADCTSLTSLDLSNIHVRRYYLNTSDNKWYYTINSSMPEYMFYNCTALKSVKLGNAMWFGAGFSGDLSRADFVFGNCTSLKEVEFPTEVDVRLGDTSFYNCGFEELTLPGNIAGIGAGAFAFNKNLTKLVVEPNTLWPYLRGFYGCEKLADVELPYTLQGLYVSAFQDCISLKSITLPENMDFIDSNSFQGTGLTSVTIPSGVRMYSYVFADCKDLKTVVYGESISNFGWHIFENCTALTSVTLPTQGLGGISPYSFYGCTALTELTLPDTVTYISEYAFYGCTNLRTLNIPASVTGIGDFAFAGCTALTQIIIPEAVEEMGEYVFEGWTSAQTIYVETHASAPEGWSQYWNWNSKTVEVPNEDVEEGEDDMDYVIEPDVVCGAKVVWGYVRP